jgi:protein subunit release factor A
LIAKNEKRITELEELLCSQSVYTRGEQVKEYIEQLKTLKKDLPSLYTKWHQAEDMLDKAENAPS